jgi:hypothetical protein
MPDFESLPTEGWPNLVWELVPQSKKKSCCSRQEDRKGKEPANMGYDTGGTSQKVMKVGR